MIAYVAFVHDHNIAVYRFPKDLEVSKAQSLDVGAVELGGLAGCEDALMNEGFEVCGDWVCFGGSFYWATVALIPKDAADENNRRADLALALMEEDGREDSARPFRDRIDSAIAFERDMRDRDWKG